MTLINFRNRYRKVLAPLLSVGEIDFYFKHLIKSFFGWEATSIGLNPNRNLSIEESNKLEEAIQSLLDHRPLQYIIGNAQFMDHIFLVDNNVLIPRPETEELVSWILDDYSEIKKPYKLLDLGTGSGCIAISLANSNTFFDVSALDISQDALTVAKKNATHLNAAVTFYKANILELDNWESSGFDILVSNPPYIPPNERKNMKSNVLDFEPELALFVPQDNPLIFYHAIIQFAIKNLRKDGQLYFEINPNYLKDLNFFLLNTGNFSISSRKDVFGKTRFIRAIKK